MVERAHQRCDIHGGWLRAHAHTEVVVMKFIDRIDWVSTCIQTVSVVAIGFATNWWAALFVVCIYMLINHAKNGDETNG
jgi:hypothetical protein